MPPRIPQAYHRHAAPSGPWPWADLVEDEPQHLPGIPPTEPALQTASGPDKPWSCYPTSLYPNWTAKQVQRSGIGHVLQEHGPECSIYGIDVANNGQFSECAQHVVGAGNQDDFWDMIQRERPDNIRLRALFVENLSGPMLQMLGTRYNIEPFFFSSSLNWIPSRYQEGITDNGGDHITITLSFLRVIPSPITVPTSIGVPTSHVEMGRQRTGTVTSIDTHDPLILPSSQRMILNDLMAIHLVRHPESSTLISYHPPPEWMTTNAKYLHSRVCFAGQSVYWKSIFQQSPDPTFLLLSMLWYALYAWDESLESLYNHICSLETRVLKTYDIHLTRELHIIRASLLHYASLLEGFRKTAVFVGSTPNNALRAPNNDDAVPLKQSEDIMTREVNNLLSEIERLEMFRKMQDMRLENLMNLAFSSVNFDDSQDMQRLTKYSLRDSAVMKQISYLTMIFLPASFVASVFGMNVREFVSDTNGTLLRYFEVAIPLTAVTIWIILAFHHRIRHQDPSQAFWCRLGWPVEPLGRWLGWKSQEETKEAKEAV